MAPGFVEVRQTEAATVSPRAASVFLLRSTSWGSLTSSTEKISTPPSSRNRFFMPTNGQGWSREPDGPGFLGGALPTGDPTISSKGERRHAAPPHHRLCRIFPRLSGPMAYIRLDSRYRRGTFSYLKPARLMMHCTAHVYVESPVMTPLVVSPHTPTRRPSIFVYANPPNSPSGLLIVPQGIKGSLLRHAKMF